MNKVVALSLVSVFLLSILVGYLPILTTQAATSGMQTYIVQIKPPYIFAVVITNANLGTPTAPGAIGYYLNETLNATKVTVSIISVQTGQTVNSFTGNVNVSNSDEGQVDAYYSPAAQAILMVFDLAATSPTTYSMGTLVDDVYGAIGVNLINSTYPYLIDIYGNKVYTNQSATLITANAITDGTLAQWSGYATFTNPSALQANGEEAGVTVTPTKVFTAPNPAGAPAPTASATLFTPISIVKIYNQMMNDQAIGWGRSLINITVYNPLQNSNSWYLYQLNFTGPGPTTVYFYPAVQIYSADQLYNLKPTLGLFNFTGPGTGSNSFSYTIVLMATGIYEVQNGQTQVEQPATNNNNNNNGASLPVYVYYNGGKIGHVYYINDWVEATLPYYVYAGQFNGQQENQNVYLVAITFTNTPGVGANGQKEFVFPVTENGNQVNIDVCFDGNQIGVPLYAVYVNSSAYAIQFGGVNQNNGNTYGLNWINFNIKPFNLTLTSNLQLTPFPVVTQLSTSSYEEISASTMSSVGGNEYSGMLFTTPPGAGAITGTYLIEGNATIGNQYTNIVVTGFDTYTFKNMPTETLTNKPTQVGTAQVQVQINGQTYTYDNWYYYSVLGTMGTPAYPLLNGTTFYGIDVMAEVDSVGQNNEPSYVITDVFVSHYSAIYAPVNNQNNLNQLQNFMGDMAPTVSPNNLVYGQSVGVNNIPAVQVISPSRETMTLSVTPQEFYQALVDLGLWTNNTIVYVTGYYAYYQNNQYTWYPMYGTSYFRAVIIPPSVVASSITPSSLTCNNAIWVDFKSPDDVLVTGYYSGTYGMTLPQDLGNIQLANNQQLENVKAVLLLPLAELTQAETFPAGGATITSSTNNGQTKGFFSQAIAVNTQATGVMNGQYLEASGPLQFMISNYPGVSNFTEQNNVPGVLNISAVMPNGVPISWRTFQGAVPLPSVSDIGTINGYVYSTAGLQAPNPQVSSFDVVVPNILPQYNPVTNVPTPDFNVTLYVRYQFYYGLDNGMTIKPGIYYGPQNTLIVITPPNLTVGTKLTLYFVSGDYAVQHYFPKNYWNKTVTITVPNATLTLKAPRIVPLYQLSIPLQVIEPYYAAPYPAQLQIGTNTVTLLANSYNFFTATPAAGKVGVGKFVNITIRFANGTTEKILLTGNNVTTLFQGGTLNENGSCTGAYNATISIQGLMSILHLSSVSKLNGSCLTITYYDNITHEMATVKICLGGVSVISPITIHPAYIFYILTAKYVNATYGSPVTLAQRVAVQPSVSLNDTFLAKAQSGVVANLNVINVTIVDHYGNKYVIYYNSTNSSTDVMINGKIKYAYSGNLLPTIPETAPNTGIFNGTPITFVINEPGVVYKNGTVFNGTLAVKLGSKVVTLGPATNFALPAFSFAGKLFGFSSTVYVTVEDTVSSSTLTLKTYIAAYNITPIRIAPVTVPVPMPANASTKIEYVDNQPITLTPTNQYIVIHVTSIINYTYVFYIATVVQPGKNATTTPPVLVNFQTVVPVPVIGPGVVAQVPVQFSQIGALGTGYYTVTMFAVPFAGGPVISLYPAKLVFTNVYINTTVG